MDMNLIQIKQVGDLRGSLDNLAESIYQTGATVVSLFNQDQTLNGEKTFSDNVYFNSGVRMYGDFTGDSAIFTQDISVDGEITQGGYSIPLLRTPPPASEISVGNSGDMAYNSEFLYICTGTNQWGRIPFTGWA